MDVLHEVRHCVLEGLLEGLGLHRISDHSVEAELILALVNCVAIEDELEDLLRGQRVALVLEATPDPVKVSPLSRSLYFIFDLG